MTELKTEFEEFENQVDTERIGFGKRLGARLLDGLLLIILGPTIGSLLGPSVGDYFLPIIDLEQLEMLENYGLDDMMNVMTAMIAGVSIVTVLIFVLEGMTGQSPGKMILKIQNKNEDGTEASASALWLRAFAKYSDNVLSLLGLFAGIAILSSIATFAGLVIFIGCFFVLGEKKQSFHDMISKTAVFNK